MVEERQETESAKGLRTLFKRLYADAEGQKKFNLNEKQRYLTHALLQSILYGLDQECMISFEVVQCINDGENACSMSTSPFDEVGRSTCLKILDPSRDSIFGRKKPENPLDRNAIREETFFFYNCAIDHIFYGEILFDRIKSYKGQYDKAQEILRGDIDVWAENIPDAVKVAVNDHKVILVGKSLERLGKSLERSVNQSTSASEIKILLTGIASSSDESGDEGIQKFKKVIKKFIETDEFRERCDKAKNNFLEEFKSFVIKALIAIRNFIVWLMSKDTIYDLNDKCSKQFADVYKTDSKLQNFKEYVLKSEASPFKEGLVSV
jgi:hypothetical protein